MKKSGMSKMDISLLTQKFGELQVAIAAVHRESLRLTKNHGGTGIPYSPEHEAVEAMEIAVVETVWFTAAALSQQLYQGGWEYELEQILHTISEAKKGDKEAQELLEIRFFKT